MIVHPVRMNGNIIGARQTYDYLNAYRKELSHLLQEKATQKKKK